MTTTSTFPSSTQESSIHTSNELTQRVGVLLFREVVITVDVPQVYTHFYHIREAILHSKALQKECLERLELYPSYALRFLSFLEPVSMDCRESAAKASLQTLKSKLFATYTAAEFICLSDSAPLDGKFVHLAIEEPQSLEELPLKHRSVFQSREVLRFLGARGLAVVDTIHNWVAKVKKVKNDTSTKTYYVKLGGSSEISVHKKLGPLHPERSHVVQCLEIFVDLPVKAGLILMPDYGPKIYYYRGPVDVLKQHRQLCSAVDFLHSHRIAHLDIKDTNIAVRDAPGPDGEEVGDVTLLDLDIAEEVAPGQLITGPYGTDGHVAPEVQQWHSMGSGERFDAFKADVWAVGEIIQTTSWKSQTAAEFQFLHDLASDMTDRVPMKRPIIRNALQRLESFRPPSLPVPSHSSSFIGPLPSPHEIRVW